nr:zinc finger CCCH domain-containing protein 30 [Tanacetum cinerariifolium]
MNRLTIETDDTSATLLELAANNNIDGFTKLLKHDPTSVAGWDDEFPDLKGTLQELLRTNDGISRMNQFVADIEKSLYSTDEFRIFSYKITPCSRPYFHDMTACPFVHRGDNARSTFNQLQQEHNMLSPFDVNCSPKSAPFGVQSMFPRSVEAISPMSGTRVLKVAHDNQNHQELRSLSSSERGSNLVDLWSEQGSSSRKPDWAVDKAEPNFPWVQLLVNETPHEVKEGAMYDGDGSNLKNELEQTDEAIFCIEQMQLEGLVDQPNSIGRQYRSDMDRIDKRDLKERIR